MPIMVSVHWNLTPVSGRVSDMVFLMIPTADGLYADRHRYLGEEGNFIDALAYDPPAMVLGTIPLAVIVRMTCSSMLKCWGGLHLRPARAKGLTRCARHYRSCSA